MEIITKRVLGTQAPEARRVAISIGSSAAGEANCREVRARRL